MTSSTRRLILAAVVSLALLAMAGPVLATRGLAPAKDADTPHAPDLANPGMECNQGYHPQPGIRGLVPDGWTAVLLDGRPELNSTRTYFAGSCGGSGFIERIEGEDSLVMLSEDIETPPLPGKPFDAVVYQRATVTPGVAYSLSAWMVSLCGGSAMPNDCPPGVYMAKMLGIDPSGGTNPLAPGVVWIEDRRNFTESRWANLRLGATAQSNAITLFARIRSPSAGTARTPSWTRLAWCKRRPRSSSTCRPACRARRPRCAGRATWGQTSRPSPAARTGCCSTCSSGRPAKRRGTTGWWTSRPARPSSPSMAAWACRPSSFACAPAPNSPKAATAPGPTTATPASGASRPV